MSRFLIAYSTTDGHTPRICARLQRVIEGQGHVVTVVPLADAEALDLTGFDRIVLGAASATASTSRRWRSSSPATSRCWSAQQPRSSR